MIYSYCNNAHVYHAREETGNIVLHGLLPDWIVAWTVLLDSPSMYVCECWQKDWLPCEMHKASFKAAAEGWAELRERENSYMQAMHCF